ncbi:AAA family ATPase [Bengtsoniella intestinalis]|uniref:AAA family ATPase n=1 Tax=Bengtsoniella intestinalis TaxID=3073143 RepID=UPI00391F3DEF
MSEHKKEATTLNPSVGADGGQSLKILTETIVADKLPNCNDLQTISMTELFDTVYPPRLAIVENFLYEGTYLFVGAPKVGKSFFMAQLGYAVSKGIPLWGFPVHRGEVLYLALEDNYGRLQHRLSTMYGTESTDDFHMAIMARKLKEGLPDQLEAFLESHKNTRLIIIDTLKKIRDKEQEQNAYDADYEIMDALKGFAENRNICLLIVHHTRKQGSSDIADLISGSNGLLGAADGAFVMQKANRIEGKSTIDIVGRDQQDQRLHLDFDTDTCIWNLTKTETKITTPPPDPLLEKVARLLTAEAPTWEGSSSELLALLDEPELQPNTLARKLNVSVDRLISEYGIDYDNRRTHSGKVITLSKRVDCVDVLRGTPTPQNIDTSTQMDGLEGVSE